MKELSFSTDITASPSAIWQVLWSDKTFRDWANYIDEGMYLKGEIAEGNIVTFVGSGSSAQVKSLVKVCKLYQQVTFRHQSEAEYGGEWAGGSESYLLTPQRDSTKLTLTLDVPAEHRAGFKAQIPKALARIKELAENTSHTSAERNNLAIGIALGVSLGAGVGLTVFDNLAVGMGFGIAIGVAIGVALDQK